MAYRSAQDLARALRSPDGNIRQRAVDDVNGLTLDEPACRITVDSGMYIYAVAIRNMFVTDSGLDMIEGATLVKIGLSFNPVEEAKRAFEVQKYMEEWVKENNLAAVEVRAEVLWYLPLPAFEVLSIGEWEDWAGFKFGRSIKKSTAKGTLHLNSFFG
jgi:hypothetical protein